MKSNVKNDFVMPILVLTCICLFMGALLAFTNSVTSPIITATEKAAAEEARKEVLPEADSFELMDEVADLPDSITAVYKASNDCGYVFMITSDGYGGKDTMKIICGIDSSGYITSTKVLSQAETAGLGTKIMEPEFKDQFDGMDESMEGITKISGATFSSNYYINALRDAFSAYELIKGGA